MAFVNDNQVEEISRHLFIGFLVFFWSGNGLVQRQMHLISRIDGAPGNFSHRITERLKVVTFSLINQDVAVRQE